MERTQAPPFLTPARQGTFVTETWYRIRANRTLTGLLLAAAFMIFLGLVQFSTPDMPDNDGFYHIKLAYLMRTEGLKPAFPWLPLSILNAREFYDHHFLFHAALIPFTFGDLRSGAKWAAVVFAALAMLSTWSLFKNQRIPYAALWALGLMDVSEAFIFRLSITRAQSLSLAFLMLGADWLLRHKHKRLAALAFLYVWLYDAFPLLLAAAVVYAAAAWLLERRLELRPVLYIAAGTILGLVINPYFPHNLIFTAMHILPKLSDATSVQVGNEWFPYTTGQLIENSGLALAALAAGVLALGMNAKRMDLRTGFSLGMVALFGLMLMQSRRFIEYFPAFALVFAAFSVTAVLRKEDETEQPRRSNRLPALIMLAILVPGTWLTLRGSQHSLEAAKPYETYAQASAWLQTHTAEGTRVFQTDWDDFPRLFFYNTSNTYLIGLDPTYMQLYNPELYEAWVEITRGQVERPSTSILEDFGARYVLTDLKHTGFLKQAAQDPGMREVYRDEYAVILEIEAQPGQ